MYTTEIVITQYEGGCVSVEFVEAASWRPEWLERWRDVGRLS